MCTPLFIRIVSIIFLVLSFTQAHSTTLKIATISPDGSVWMKKMRAGAKEISEKTNGRVQLKYYPGGVMGNDKAVIRKIRIGQLHGGALVIGSLAEMAKDIQIYSLPMNYSSLSEINYVRQKTDPIVLGSLEKEGFVTLGLASGGQGYVMSKEPIRSVGDMRTTKVWIPNNDVTVQESAKSFDIKPIPLAIADVRAGLQTGLINTVTTSPIGALALQWHTQIKYLMEVPFMYVFGILAVDKRTFSKISPVDQNVLRQIMGRVFDEIDAQNQKDNIAAIEALRKQGIKFIQPASEQLEEWHAIASKLPHRLVKTGRLSQKIVSIMQERINECRTNRKSLTQ